MRIDAEQLIQENSIVEVVSRYVHLKKEGVEHVGLCPFHQDDKPSIKVNEKKKMYKCFACGAGGDTIDFLMRMGMSFHDAVNSIKDPNNTEARQHGVEQRQAKPAVAAPNSWKPVTPAPNEPTEFRHYRHGVASRSWAYRDLDGNVLGYVCRFDLADGSKEVLPYVYATDGNRSEWRWMGLDKPRPLYNLHLIKQYPNASVLICEGEKTADAINAELDPNKTIAVTWIGGSNGIENADFSPLSGRKVMYWPDHDTEQKYPQKHAKAGQVKPWHEQPGNHAMLEINKVLEPICPIRRWIAVPDTYPHKWDAADKEWEEGELRKFVLENIGDIPEVPHYMETEFEISEPVKPAPKPRVEGPKNPPPPPRTEAPQLSDVGSDIGFAFNDHFRMLGYDKDENSRLVYYFFSFDAKAVIKLAPSSMTKSNLMMLAPLNWWEQMFPGSKSARIDADAAVQFLIFHSHQVGTFKEKFIRGRGAWVDEGKFIIHTGDILLVNGSPIPLKSFRSRYVYEIGERLGFGMTDGLRASEASKLVQKAKWLLWEREINAYLLAGWCVIAPFCGILQWRPHIWVTGPAGSGKSWVMDNIVKRLLGDTALVVQGKTTEAGVRGLLQNDARAVLFDESDVDNNNDKERVQNVLALARSSSYHDGGQIGKGTQSGGSRTYTMRSCFAFSSIGVQLNQQSDRSRFSILGLVSFEGKRSKEDFQQFERDWTSLVTDDYVKALQSRTMGLLPVILKNSRTFADAVAHVIGQRRIGDQVGGMLAGAYSLNSTKEISYDDAIEWVKARDWTDERGLELTKDEYRLFGRLMGFVTKVETELGIKERTIGELILIASRFRTELGLSADVASNRLRRLGFRITKDKVNISSTADSIVSMLRDTPWVNNYNKILERLPGAEKVEPMTYFPGIRSRGVSVPLSMVTDGSDMPIETPYSHQWMGEQADCPF